MNLEIVSPIRHKERNELILIPADMLAFVQRILNGKKIIPTVGLHVHPNVISCNALDATRL